MMKYKHDEILDMNIEAFDKLLEVIQESKGATKEEVDAANSLAMATTGGGGSTMGGVFSKMVVDTASLPPPPAEVTPAEDAAADQAAERAENNPITDTENEPSSPWTPLGSSSTGTTTATASTSSSPVSSTTTRGVVSSVLDMFEPVKAPTIQVSGEPKFMTSQDKFLMHQAGELSGLATVKPRKIPSICIRNPSACDLSKFQTTV